MRFGQKAIYTEESPLLQDRPWARSAGWNERLYWRGYGFLQVKTLQEPEYLHSVAIVPEAVPCNWRRPKPFVAS